MMKNMSKYSVIGIGVSISAAFVILVIMGNGNLDFDSEKENGKINMNPELHPCEILTNEMIQARDSMKQYVFNPDQLSFEESEKIRNEYENELNRIIREFELKGCDKDFDEWITPEITQRVIDQTGG